MRSFLFLTAIFAFLLQAHPSAASDQKEAERALKAGDYAKALSLLEPLAEQGDASAQVRLGRMFEQGLGVAANRMKAVELFRKAAAQGNADGAFDLGMAYGSGGDLRQDKEQQAHWLRRAAEGGHARAAYVLAGMLIKGDGIAKSPEEGFAFMNLARRGNDMDAALFLRNQLDMTADKLHVRYEGGFGDTVETAARIRGVAGKPDGAEAERAFVERIHPGWRNYKQSLLAIDGRYYDAFELTSSSGAKGTVYFDVTDWHRPEK